MTVLSFTVPGPPRGKGRPRFGRTKAGAPVTFTDPKTASYENLIALAAQRALGDRPMLDGPISFHIVARFAPPISTPRKLAAAMLSGEVSPTKRIDLDNILKACLDGCQGVAFRDDVLVTRISASKVYAASPGVDVEISPALTPTQSAAAADEVAA